MGDGYVCVTSDVFTSCRAGRGGGGILLGLVCDLPVMSLFVPQDFRRLLKKEEKPLLMMFYAPCE